jgi:hypothetical protein
MEESHLSAYTIKDNILINADAKRVFKGLTCESSSYLLVGLVITTWKLKDFNNFLGVTHIL